MKTLLVGVLALLALLATASVASAQSGYVDATAAEADASATVAVASGVSPLQLELDALRSALDDSSYAEWRDRLLACVTEQTRSSASVTSLAAAHAATKLALAECIARLGVNLPSSGVSGYFGLGSIGSDGKTAPAAPSCGDISVDPRLAGGYATRPPTEAERQTYNLDSTQRMYTEEGFKKLQQDQLAEADAKFEAMKETDEWKRHKEAMDNDDPNWDATFKALEGTKEYKEWKRAQDRYTEQPPYTAPLVSQTDPNYVDEACTGATEQIAECERSGWTSFDCQKLKQQLECGTVYAPEVAMPTGEEQPCFKDNTREGTAEEFAYASLIACEALVQYGPDDPSPCSAGVVAELAENPEGVEVVPCPERASGGSPDEGFAESGGSEGAVCIRLNVCASVIAMPDPTSDSCAGQVTMMKVRASAAELIASAWPKLGGPVWTPPPPPPPPGGPDPSPTVSGDLSVEGPTGYGWEEPYPGGDDPYPGGP